MIQKCDSYDAVRSSDITPGDFCLWEEIDTSNVRVFVPQLQTDVGELKTYISADFHSVRQDMLKRLWCELWYPSCFCRDSYSTLIAVLN